MSNEIIPFNDLQQMAVTMSKSGMFGKTPDQMLSLMLIAQAEGIHPACAAMEYDIIQGRPALRGQAALARFQQSGGSIKWIERSDKRAKATFSHPKGGELTIDWTMERAAKMGLSCKDNWKKQPEVMLTWRCIAEGVRAVYPACLNRMYLSEEVQDFEAPKERNITQEPETYVDFSHEEQEEPGPIIEETDIERASRLTKEAGFTTTEKAKRFSAVKGDVAKYCEETEKYIAAKKSEDPEFALETPLSVEEMVLKIEEYSHDETLPVRALDEIKNAIEIDERDPVKLSNLLNKIKTAKK